MVITSTTTKENIVGKIKEEIYYLDQDMRDRQWFGQYEENLKDIDIFKSFLHDIDFNDLEWVSIHGQMNSDPHDKVWAYDLMMIMYEQYVEDFTELFYE